MSFLLRHKFWLIAVLVIVAAIFATRMRRTAEPSMTGVPGNSAAGQKGPAAGAMDAPNASAAPSEPVVPLTPIVQHDAANEMSKMLTDPTRSEEERVQAVKEILYLYRQGFGDNPPGQNELVTSALIGENEKRTALLPKDSPAIRNGALVDPWGSPYWFHAISSKTMEVRSPGPDKELFTDDDVLVE